MLFAVHFVDKPSHREVRSQYLQAHLEWLDQHKESVLIGGSLRKESGDQPVGGLWIVEAESRAEIEILIQTDPFWMNGLRESCEIHFWSKAFRDRRVLV